jgi:hypothetical protein
VPTRTFLQMTLGWFGRIRGSASSRRRIISIRPIRSSAIWGGFVAFPMKANCSTA